MNSSWFIKPGIITLLLFLNSCSKNSFYVYDKNFQKVKIKMQDTSQALILINNTYCAPCLPALLDSLSPQKKCSLVCMTGKSKMEAAYKLRELDNNNLQFQEIYFQFHKKNDPFTPRRSNKLYRKFNQVASPFAIIYDQDSIQVVK